MTHPDDMPSPPDGPTPAREQLPLPRRRRQSHLEPQLRTPGGPGSGTPFAAFTADGAAGHTATNPATNPAECCADRAAAFHAGTHRGRSTSPDAAPPTARPHGPETERHATDR